MNIVKKVEEILFDADIEEYKQEAKLIIKEISNQSIEELLINNYQNLNEDKILSAAKERAATKKPLAYILGYSYFANDKYYVNENVLIPRDETEILVGEAYELIKNKTGKINILDIGGGSGCISCALAKKLKGKDIEILCTDISLEAIEIILKNIENLGLIRKIIVRKSDLFSKIRETEKFDLIISNPPYIPISQKENLQSEVLFEPHQALFAKDKEGIEFYKKIILDVPKFLKKDGFIALELGINQGKPIKNLLQKDFCDIRVIKDLAQIERVITAKIK